jgi:hypothetical protein
MNLGVERFLILGCIAVVILEMPNLIADLQSASVQAKTVEALVAKQVNAPSTPPRVGPEVATGPLGEAASFELTGAPSLASAKVIDVAKLLPAQAGL